MRKAKEHVMRNSIVGMAAIAAAFAFVSLADARPEVQAAGPAPGSVVKGSPKALRIQFNEPIVLELSGLAVTNEQGVKQRTGQARIDPTDKKQLIVPLSADLAPGKYTVRWYAVGDDTHRD